MEMMELATAICAPVAITAPERESNEPRILASEG
jgi:hypothetical protein